LEKENITHTTDLTNLTIDMKQMLKYIEVSAPEIRRTLKQMQQTSISFINEELKEELMINLLPYINFKWGKNEVEIKIFTKIAKLIVDVKNNYTFINTKTLMNLKNKHSLRLLPMLNTINQYSDNVAKRKKLDLEAINDLFGTNYKRLIECERKIFAPVKEELDMNSKLTFLYETNFDNFGKGRPKATSITIDVIDNSKSLFAQ
jgi:plasmid replication initiation protein